MTLWTPDGERHVSSEPSGGQGGQPSPSPEAPAGFENPADALSPEEQEQAAAMAKELAEARARLLETEVSTVLANHALGIYELAAIHLTADRPDFEEAKLAVDALASLVEGLEGRLGDGEPTLKDALHQVRMAFVQRKNEPAGSAPSADEA